MGCDFPTKLSTETGGQAPLARKRRRAGVRRARRKAARASCAIILRCLQPCAERDLLSIIQAAGWPIWPLIACSVLALALIIERFIALKTARVAPPTLLDEAITVSSKGVPAPDVVAQLAQNSALGEVLASGLRTLNSDPQATEVDVRESMENTGRAVAHRLEKYLNALATIASAAPLLGLFGTVVGMIEIFGSQSPTGTNPQQLAHGISVALYNTGFGLVIAIPSLIFWRHFRALVDGFVVEMEQQAVRLVEYMHGDRT
ncbi:hypothetical protein SDC9_151278 [bioreactor metagenome]|uniref:MotA/TolQ/ExbB proton channel domain-containing protein n=1 Tax=bioreactor metagenome TaxID=1076179 RepID=A0A645ERY2_9ZZZZ